NRMKHAPCLSFRAQRDCELRMRRFSREAQGTPSCLHDGASLRVAFLLGTFLWRSKEKYLAGGRESPHPIRPACKAQQQPHLPVRTQGRISPQIPALRTRRRAMRLDHLR
ncbi:MAG: hypothetical protein WBN57_06800, partial [Gammaproteobacteria bacterium]